MNKRAVVSCLFLVIVSAILLTQIQVVRAEQRSENVLTDPISYFTVSGKVLYKLMNGFIPAANVRVRAKNLGMGQEYETYTGLDGTYSLSVGKGTYLVRPSDSYGTRFVPAERIIRAVRDVLSVNFVGIKS